MKLLKRGSSEGGKRMDKQVKNILKLMESMGIEDVFIPDQFEHDTPDEELVYEWSDI